MKPGQFGVHVFVGHRVMPAMCENCPFRDGGIELLPERMEGIKFSLTMGQPFWCHKTVHQKKVAFETDPETGDEERPSYSRHYQQCKGAIDWALEFKQKHDGDRDNGQEGT